VKGDRIPDNDHISRFCKPTQAPNGQIQATAFLLRTDEESLSVNWLEFLKCANRLSEINEIRRIYSETFSRVSANARILVLNVGEIRNIVLAGTKDNRDLRVLHDPIVGGDQSHSGIYDLEPDNELIAELILEVIHDNEIYSARMQ
jgi:hypothetical protein